eukprot:scaffold42727_cov55-Phaeocystis_antarctica.AAC.1
MHGEQVAMLLCELDRLVGQAHERRAVLVPLGPVLVRKLPDVLELLGVELQLVHDGAERAGVRLASPGADLKGVEVLQKGRERGEHVGKVFLRLSTENGAVTAKTAAGFASFERGRY